MPEPESCGIECEPRICHRCGGGDGLMVVARVGGREQWQHPVPHCIRTAVPAPEPAAPSCEEQLAELRTAYAAEKELADRYRDLLH